MFSRQQHNIRRRTRGARVCRNVVASKESVVGDETISAKVFSRQGCRAPTSFSVAPLPFREKSCRTNLGRVTGSPETLSLPMLIIDDTDAMLIRASSRESDGENVSPRFVMSVK